MSRIAEGLLRTLGGDRFEAYSAGTDPVAVVHPLAVEVMSELGIDISGQQPKPVRLFLGRPVGPTIAHGSLTGSERTTRAESMMLQFDAIAISEATRTRSQSRLPRAALCGACSLRGPHRSDRADVDSQSAVRPERSLPFERAAGSLPRGNGTEGRYRRNAPLSAAPAKTFRASLRTRRSAAIMNQFCDSHAAKSVYCRRW